MNYLDHILAATLSKEPFLQERIERAEKRAKKIINASFESEEELMDRLIFIISRYYKIPFFDKRFEDVSFDDLVLEVMLITESEKETHDRSSETIKEHLAEAEDAFSGLMEESLDIPDTFSEEEQSFLKESEGFFQKGFAGVNK